MDITSTNSTATTIHISHEWVANVEITAGDDAQNHAVSPLTISARNILKYTRIITRLTCTERPVGSP